MIKKTVKYTNFDGVEKTRDVYFHLGKADMARIHANTAFLEEMQAAAERKDTKVLLEKIEYMVRLSYGVRSEDGERFVKTKEVQDDFIHSALYEEFIIQLLTEDNGFPRFIKSVFPPKLIAEVQEMVRAGRIEDPFKEPANPKSNQGEPAKEETIAAAKFNDFGKPAVVEAEKFNIVEDKFHDENRPLYQRENRMPTDAELREMSNEELRAAALWVPRP